MLGFRAEAGSRPGGRGTFLCFAKEKYPKERRPPVCDPFAVRRGNLRRGGSGVRRGTRFAAAQRRSDSHGESDHEAWALRRPCHPATAPTQAQPAGGGQPNIQTSARAVAALGPATTAPSARRLRPRSGAERSDGPSGCLLPIPSVCAEERSGQRIRARDCLSEASLSETPLDASTAGCPVAQRRGRRQWGRLLLPSFLGDARKEGAPPGAYPGTRPWHRHTAQSASNPQLRQTQPQRLKVTPFAINSVAASAYPISARTQKHLKPQRPTP